MSVGTENQAEVLKKVSEVLFKAVENAKNIVKEYSPLEEMETFGVWTTVKIDDSRVHIDESWKKGKKF